MGVKRSDHLLVTCGFAQAGVRRTQIRADRPYAVKAVRLPNQANRMAETRMPGIQRGADSSPSPAANPQAKHMIGVSDPYRGRYLAIAARFAVGSMPPPRPRSGLRGERESSSRRRGVAYDTNRATNLRAVSATSCQLSSITRA